MKNDNLNTITYGKGSGNYLEIDTGGNLVYRWWCPQCKVDHYTPYCPIEEYKRLAKLWKNPFLEYCPHCGQIIKKE